MNTGLEIRQIDKFLGSQQDYPDKTWWPCQILGYPAKYFLSTVKILNYINNKLDIFIQVLCML